MSKLLEALAVMAELTGTDWSKPAIRAIEQELVGHPEADVLGAIRRCQKECRGRVALADILDRLSSQHPGPEQAWAIVWPKVTSDAPTIFVTGPMREAYGAALALEDDLIAARMAFKETYAQAVSQAKTAGALVEWSMIPGTHQAMREAAIQEAVKKGIAQDEWAMRQLPVEAHGTLLEFAGQSAVKRLA